MKDDLALEVTIYAFVTIIIMEIFTIAVSVYRGDSEVAAIVSISFALTIFLFITFLKASK